MLRSSIAHATIARSSGTLIRFKGAPPRRCLATVSSLIDADVPPLLDARVLQAAARQHQTPISDILKQYVTASGTACPAPERRPHIADPGESAREVVTVAHVARDGLDHKVTLASGFVLNAMAPRVEGQDEEAMVLTCAHTLEELRQWPLLEPATKNPRTKQASGSFTVLSALPLSDLLLLSCPMPPESVRALPVSPYPAHRDTPILAHFVSHGKPKMAGWNQWIGDTWGKWEKGKVVGYRDFAGRETQVSGRFD
ncbi:hypothetical protein BJ912DRAFT_943539 [Pholiota molesta]|nr:hypothetical protein BJ912DRAFT_943539 [Pholiota molesta]